MAENLIDQLVCPMGLYFIDTNLWLGNLAAATHIQLLKEKKVRYLLTVNSFPLPESIRNLSFIKKKYIKVFDSAEDDLLSYFDETYEFIEEGLKRNVVLVHCYHGVSRSPSVVISYLMKKKKITLKEALEYVKSKSELIEPNPGFLEQLKLYEIMKCTLDKTNAQYKMFRLDKTLNLLRKVNDVSKYCAEVIQTDPSVMTVNADSTVYKCRNCRRVVARGLNEIPHVSHGKYDWRDNRLSEHSDKMDFCQLAYFVEPLVWMENVRIFCEGKIHCPNKACKNKLGAFNWISGVECPCGTKVCPGFYLIPSKVDKQKNLNMKS